MPFLGSKYAKIALEAGTRWGSFQLPRPPSWIKGGLLLRGRERRGLRREMEGRGERRGRGSCAPFLKFLDPRL